MKLFALRDSKSNLFLTPNFQRSIADAIRSFTTVANDPAPNSMVSMFPGDFRLFHLADIDLDTGKITVLDIPADLGSGIDFKSSPKIESALPFPKQATQ